ncbi:MAG: PAS domain S-box protein, partial [Leptolyngbyaceae bacterium]|nr:PAS domain S-box protein [Leptolyngbyaceae bacterium]
MEWVVERLRLAINAAQLGFWDWDVAQQRQEWSPQAEQILGYAPGTVDHTYENWVKRLHPEDRERVESQIQATLQTYCALNLEYRIILPNGDCRWIEAQGRMILDGDEHPTRLVGLLQDITDRKRMVKSLQSSEARFRAVFEQAAVGIARVATDGRWIQVNQTLCDFLGYAPEELLQHTVQSVTMPEDVAGDEQHYQQLLGGEVDCFRREKRYRHKEGHPVWGFVTVSKECDPDGNFLCFIVVVENIQARKQIEQELHQRAQELTTLNMVLVQTTTMLDKRNSELDQFAYVASHDLKAPLRAIANLSEWIEEDLSGQLPAENERQLQLLRSRVLRMERLIDGLLAYSRVGRRDRLIESVDVGQLLDEVIDSLAPPPSFKLVVSSALPVFDTQPTALRQVFANLIGNAVKHHHREEGCITITVADYETAYEFAVSDDGPGIDPRYHDKVFVIFQTL